MRTLTGTVESGMGGAARTLAPVVALIEDRIGLRPLQPGTLNLRLAAPYIVVPDAQVTRFEYNRVEYLKLQRCRVGGTRALIVRPDTHESGLVHGPAHVELMATVDLRAHLAVADGASVQVQVEGDDAWWGEAWTPPPMESLRFNVFGRVVLLRRERGLWQAYAVGNDGKRAPAGFVVPQDVQAHELGQYLHDLFHEHAQPGKGDVRRID